MAHSVSTLLKDILSFESVTQELPLAEFLGQYFQKLGVNAEIQKIPGTEGRANIIARVGGDGSGKRVLFEGHLDVVPAAEGWTVPPFQASQKDGRIYGRGASDMKSGVAAMICAAEQLLKEGYDFQNNQLVLVFVADEEVGCRGIKTFLASDAFQGADFAVISEPTNLEIALCHKGSCHYKITLYGRSAHAATPQLGVNALAYGARVIEAIQELAERLSRRTYPRLGGAVLSPTLISAGSCWNVIPDRCTVTVDRRLLPGETAEDAGQELAALLEDLKAKDPVFRYSLELVQLAEAGAITEDCEAARLGARAYFKAFGKEACFRGFGVTCEQAFLVHAGVPTFIFGPGDCELCHVPDEYVLEEKLEKAAAFFCCFVKEAFQSCAEGGRA